jgi:hypothetical protein
LRVALNTKDTKDTKDRGSYFCADVLNAAPSGYLALVTAGQVARS